MLQSFFGCQYPTSEHIQKQLKSSQEYFFTPFKGDKISKRPPILISSSSWCKKWQRKITLSSNLLYKFKRRVIFCCRFWQRLGR